MFTIEDLTNEFVDLRDILAALEAAEDEMSEAHREVRELKEQNAPESVIIGAEDDAFLATETFHELERIVAEFDDQMWQSMEEMAQNEPTLIAKWYFTDFAQDFAYDIGAIGNRDDDWPLYCIDWERAAADLAMDYSEVILDQHTFLIRDY